MSAFTQELLFSEANDMPSPRWLVALGITLLIGTVFQELVGMSLQDIIEVAKKGADLIATFF